ncbi:platelet-derived growth factor receptor alpha isoform X1 [Paramuricea clavata]|uniref:Platelet-derived growth factor receptor alpha isoform X1 n=1 Tax=Paramuricea clavata TaxID=317549 RepID=A0A7D9HGG4_PARCT|nr:platelet-derived growth factor receptor alpha isoform X1 [Paramuricea clavata]
MFLKWTDVTWKNAEKITYFKVQIRNGGSVILREYVSAFSNVSRYSKTIFNLTYGTNNYLSIYGYHGDHCLSKYVEALDVTAIPACENANCTIHKPNSTCKPDGYHGKYNCICDYGFFNEKNRCIDKNPCRRNTCAENQKCTPIVKTGGHNCTCKNNFIEENGTCKPVDLCATNPCGIGHNCTTIVATGKHKCTCEKTFIEKNGTCEKVPPETKDYSVTTNSKGVIVAAVLTPSLVILVAILIIVWLRKRHEKRMDFMEREMVIAFDVGSRSNPRRFINRDTLEEDGGERVVNLLYVSQDNVYGIPRSIADKIRSFEMPAESIRFSGIIGRGEFGKVYVGEVQGANINPKWTTVAIKTFKESANEEDLSDIFREIELMTDLGKHENVIQMFGCCTNCRPICLVLEYAPGGNLKLYLRSLKKKCKDIASKRIDGVTKSSKEGYRKLIEAGKSDAISSIPGNASERYKFEEARPKQTEDLNIEIASRINEEIRYALDPKELESFARQIATGMKYISGLGIVHRDLAARNILLGEEKVLKISDFGLSREGTYIKKSNGKIPFRWLSIEAIEERAYSTASDVWAFGVVLWEICTLGDTPYPSVSDRDLKDFLLSGKRLEKVDSCTDNVYEIMVRCWSHLPKDRPTFSALSDKLWDLEHNENTYVNVDSLMRQSIECEDYEEDHEQLNQVN